MGCGSSTPAAATPEQLAVNLLMAAQRKGKHISQYNAMAAAQCNAGSTPEEVLAWLDDPVLKPSTEPAAEGQEAFELEVPMEMRGQMDVRLPTTLTLPSMQRLCIAIDGPAGETVSLLIPSKALQALGADTVRVYHPPAQPEYVPAEQLRQQQMVATDEDRLSPISAEDLEDEAPIILPEDVPESLWAGEARCLVCCEALRLPGGGATALRQLPCSHAFHAACVDPWLRAFERSCPACRAPVGVARAPPTAACRRGSTSYESYLEMRNNGSLAALIRANHLERDASDRRAEEEERQNAAARQTFGLVALPV